MKRILKQLSFQAFRLAARAGVYVLPAHYYVPLANLHQLEKTRPLWARKSELPGIATSLDEQAAELERICMPYQLEYAGNHAYREAVEQRFGPGYGYIEAQALHAVVRHYKPKRIIEVGSGVSTWCMLQALEQNERETGESFELTCIEPYPYAPLRALERVGLIDSPVQSVPFDVFAQLGAGDLLFIDSSHAVRPGGDVNFLILEVLPRLAPGVIVHVHDIYLPYDYPRDVLRSYFQWMETSLLRAFLINNSRARIVFCLSQLHYDRANVLQRVFPEYVPARDEDGLQVDATGHFPASIYVEVA